MTTRRDWLVIIGIVIIILIPTTYIFYQSQKPISPFSMQVIPAQMEDTIPGQRCVFLASVVDEGSGRGEGQAVNIEVTVLSSTVTVTPQAITPEQVAEIAVIPDEASVGQTVTVTINGEREGLTTTVGATLNVNDALGPVEDLKALATEIRDLFIPWLAANHPELSITSETEWTGTIVHPNIAVVMFYLFFSEEWEMGVSWHVMIPPTRLGTHLPQTSNYGDATIACFRDLVQGGTRRPSCCRP